MSWHELAFRSFGRYGELSHALGGYSDASQDGEQSKWRPDMRAVRATINFALATKRLDYVPEGRVLGSQTDVVTT